MEQSTASAQPVAWDNPLYLLQQFQQGNNRAFYLLFKAHYTSLGHFATYLINNQEDAEDIVSQAFLKLWQQCRTFTSIDSIKPFLIVVVRNACFDYLKHHKVKEKAQRELIFTATHTEEDIQARLMKAEVLQRAVREIDRLPVRMRQVFKMAYGKDGLDNATIAAKLKISESTVRVQKAKALHLIKQALQRSEFLVLLSVLVTGSYFN
ncbi:hypothetical protein F5148DRAFT_1150332 [Russula earlei]|uniref:Uncharacterized protein n=1 Tax=Russula earlei TaxID=71964 RepID=A0ACC0U5J5_9AGAM|nr:hypothetical protein F5148DRAFT_1150332 [Russula earlei]